VAIAHTPPIPDGITIKEGVDLLADTPYPVTYNQLRYLLDEADVDRERYGRGYRYSATDVLELHRDRVAPKVSSN
jgi:hypothetical protein